MSLVEQQGIFLVHVRELIGRATELGFVVTGGELYRTLDQQRIHVESGRSKTLDSLHLERLAIDLNFFLPDPDGALKLTYDREQIRPLGEFWEGLDPANEWGGNWTNFKDVPHFQRNPEKVRRAAAAPGGTAALGTRGVGLLGGAVGAGQRNDREDTELVQRLINRCLDQDRVRLDATLTADGIFGAKTLAGIRAVQTQMLAMAEPDGIVSPRGTTIRALGSSLPEAVDADLLALAFLRASAAAVAELGEAIVATMLRYEMTTPLRQAHFLAQIGHESGELRFREEIASGRAYEGRRDLGNTEPGDGPRFKGRGLIQLTGRANYRDFAKAVGRQDEILADPTLVARDPALCVGVAGWFWDRHGLNAHADRDDLLKVTKVINGGTNGLADRRRLLARAKGLFGIA